MTSAEEGYFDRNFCMFKDKHTVFSRGKTGTLTNRKKFVPKKWCSLKKRSSLRIILEFHNFRPKKEVSFKKNRYSF